MDKKYEILGVKESDSVETIKKAYREMSIKFHPDTNGGAVVNEEIFRMLSQAYTEIMDEKTGKRPSSGQGQDGEEAKGRSQKGPSWIHQSAREGVIEGTVLFLSVLKVGLRILQAIIGALSRTRI